MTRSLSVPPLTLQYSRSDCPRVLSVYSSLERKHPSLKLKGGTALRRGRGWVAVSPAVTGSTVATLP
jgi:hypothetical protein